MGKRPANFEVTCPCCKSVLKVDTSTEAVISHTPPPQAKTFADFDEAVKGMKDQDSRRESLFRQSVEAEKHKEDLLEKKFQEALRKAKEEPDKKIIRDIDL